MKKYILIILVLISLILSACKEAESPPANVDQGSESQPTILPAPTDAPPPTATATSPPPTVTPTEVPPTLAEIAEEIAGKEGVVITVEDRGSDETVYIFEERHDSILGQVEIAMMLDKLYADHDLRLIGLEGLTVEDSPLDLSYMHVEPYYQPEQPITGREDVLVQTLQEGEISSAELLGLVYHDMVVAGIDNAELYAISIDPMIWYTAHDHNYQIITCKMSDEQFDFWRELMQKEEYQMAYDYALQSSETGQEMLDRIQGKNSAEEFIEMLDELEVGVKDCAEKYGNPVPPKLVNDITALREYLDIVVERSEAMASAVLGLTEAQPGEPVAIAIGLMHTARIVELLSEAGLSVVVIRPTSLEEDNIAGLLSKEAYQRKQEGQSVVPDGYLGAFLDGRGKKPTPVAQKGWYEFSVKIREILQIFAWRTAHGLPVGDQRLTGDAWNGIDVEIVSIISGDANNPNPIVEWQVRKRWVEGVETSGEVNKIISEIFGKEALLESGDHRDKILLRGIAQLVSGKEEKVDVTLFGRLNTAKEMILNQDDTSEQESSSRGEFPTQLGCSNTQISVTGVSD